jgi:hypothetical protein
MKRRVTVNFAAAEADSGEGASANKAASFTSGAALADPSRNPAFLLLLAQLCRHFSGNGVARALSTMLSDTLPTRADLAAQGVALAADELADSYGSMVDVPDLIKRTQVGRFRFDCVCIVCVIMICIVAGGWTGAAATLRLPARHAAIRHRAPRPHGG